MFQMSQTVVAMGGRTLAGDTADSCECSVIDTRFRVYSGQARAASLAETVGTTSPAFLLRRVYYVASMSWALSADVNRDRFILLRYNELFRLFANFLSLIFYLDFFQKVQIFRISVRIGS